MTDFPNQIFSDLNQIKQFASQIREELDSEQITVEKGDISLTINGGQKVTVVKIGGVPDERLKDVINEAVQKSQQMAAKKLAELPQK